MNRILLHGALAEEFGHEHLLAVRSPREAIKALGVNKAGFFAAIEHGEYKVIRKPRGREFGMELDEAGLFVGMSESELHIIPMPAGSKSGGAGKILIGVALIGAAIVTAGGAAAFAGSVGAFAGGAGMTLSVGLSLMGASLVLGGVSQMLMPSPAAPGPNSQERDEQSFIFNSATNSFAQGHPVPIPYGRFRIGSVVGSSGIYVEQIGVNRGDSPLDTSGGDGFFGGLFPSFPDAGQDLA